MAATLSVGAKIQLIHGLVDTRDVNEWQNKFLKSIWQQSGEGKRTAHLSEKQLDVIDEIHSRYFGGGDGNGR